MAIIYHNPRCGKSRQTLKILHELDNNVQIVEYLKVCPDEKELKEVISMLGMKPLEVIRKSESVFKEHYKGKELTDEEWINAMVEHPILIERPIVIKNNKAVIGRPPENVKELY